METIKSPHLTRQPCRLTLLLAVGLVLTSGCAQIPRLDPPPAMKKVDELGSSNSIAVPVARARGCHSPCCEASLCIQFLL